ncbi:hypothetical protein ASPBRDRAFT_666612 [Aspergillus brasiliensis CBS 101740]|uniref:Oxidoreductase N-terminal domain-containing protein n=1 Tax=Aspergillus brasiliensis (strain CBS 101740 / IMI 381727 / IBT 21946) TaxID=767769 RepID=A0A1L9U301_ASPBC|nr:hypothetical protein ASPBRDRAFT_666612 [Aspergillus brasiliensis CBS 101740]
MRARNRFIRRTGPRGVKHPVALRQLRLLHSGSHRPEEQTFYAPAFALNKPIGTTSVAKVIRSNSNFYKVGPLVIGELPVQEYIAVDADDVAHMRALENPLGIDDIRVFLRALGMPGLTSYSSLYEIWKLKKGETIFVSAASQSVGPLAKREGLRVDGCQITPLSETFTLGGGSWVHI